MPHISPYEGEVVIWIYVSNHPPCLIKAIFKSSIKSILLIPNVFEIKIYILIIHQKRDLQKPFCFFHLLSQPGYEWGVLHSWTIVEGGFHSNTWNTAITETQILLTHDLFNTKFCSLYPFFANCSYRNIY